MDAVETIYIVCPKNPARRWRINADAFDPERHEPWPPEAPPAILRNWDTYQNLSYAALLAEAREKGIAVKGRPSKERLLSMLRDTRTPVGGMRNDS